MRWRLLASFLGVTLVVLAAQGIPLAAHLHRVERDRLIAQLERDAFIVAAVSSDALGGSRDGGTDAADLATTVELYQARDGARVVVTDSAGVAVAVSDDTGAAGDDYSNRPEIAAALTGAPASGRRHSESLDSELLYVAVPALDGSRVVGAVRVSYPAAVVDARADAKVRGLVLVGVISLAAAAVAALFLSGTVTSPLRRLQRATERLSTGDFSVRAEDDDGPPEVRHLASAFNTMTGRIEVLVDQQRAFAADASHQLRTPLTALRLQIERAAELVGTDPDRARCHVEAAGSEIERLQHLIQALLLLARPSAGADIVAIDVAALVRDRVETWKPFAAERGLDVDVASPPAAHACAAAGALEQIVDNYLDNAIAIAPPGSLVEVLVLEHAGRVDVHVLDRGPGMAPEQLTRAFDRFWRSADATHEGSGLGLAIVQRLAETSGATVSLTNRAGGGLDAAVSLARVAPT